MGKKWPNKTQTEQLANDIYDMLRRDGPLTRDDICWPTCGVRAFRYARRLLLEQGRPIVSIGGRFKIARSQRDLEAAARAVDAVASVDVLDIRSGEAFAKRLTALIQDVMEEGR